MQGLFCMRPEISEAAGGRRTVESFGFSFVDLTGGSAAPLDVVDPSFSFLTELPGTRVLLLRDSCNGLVLFVHRREHRGGRMGYVVCNPTTKEWEAVPACGDPELPLTYAYLAFDPAVSAHFHLVQFQVEEDEEFVSVHAYSSETKTWGDNQIGQLGEHGEPEGWRQVTSFLLADLNPRCPFINGFLHMLVLGQDQLKIAAVDVQGRARRMIPLPHVADGRHWKCYFGESQGKLHYMSQEILDDGEGKYNLSILALQDYDAQEWVLKATVNTYEVFGEDSCIDGTSEFEVVDIHQDCDGPVWFMEFLAHTSRERNACMKSICKIFSGMSITFRDEYNDGN